MKHKEALSDGDMGAQERVTLGSHFQENVHTCGFH